MTTEDRIKELAKNFVGSIHRSIAVRKAILDAFAAFEPEAIGLEALAFETELSQAEVSNVLIDMAQRHELIVNAVFFVVPDDGTECVPAYLPVDLPGCKSYSVTMYRLNKEWKGSNES